MNVPDYAHKPSPVEVPRYRVIADGPVRAMVEAKMGRWQIGADQVDIRALYSMAAGASHVECRFEILPVKVSRTYDVGAGIRRLPALRLSDAPGRLTLEGEQSPQIGRLGLALYYDPADADQGRPVETGEGANECIVFHQKLAPGQAVSGRYWVAAAWAGSGFPDLLGRLDAVEREARASVTVGNFQIVRTPAPQRVEGEAN